MRLLYIISLLFIFGAWTQTPPQPFQSCLAMIPFGLPNFNKDSSIICRHGYITAIDIGAKIPMYVSYLLTPQHSIGCIPRTNGFQQDKSLAKNQSAAPSDYLGNGYDQGHISPDGDNSYNEVVENESFLLSNMCPQLPNFNRGIWKLLESHVRAWAYELNAPLIVMAGPVYNIQKDKKIGTGVDVPSGFYKIIVNTKTNTSISFLFPHKEGLGNNLTKYISNLDSIEGATGFNLNIKTKEDTSMWDVDLGMFAKAKKAACK